MKTGLIVILTLLAGTLAAALLMEDPGYVMLNFRGYLVETSVPVLLLGLVAFYLLVRIVLRILAAPRKLGEMAGLYRERRDRKQLTRGLMEIAAGNWSRGERLLTRGVRHRDQPLVNYLSAARAAQLQGAYERRDNWLRMAQEQSPDASVAVLLTQAELQSDRNQFEQARTTLARLLEQAPEHPQALGMLGRLHRASGDWGSLIALLPRLRKHKTLPATELDELSREAFSRALDRLDKPTAESIEALWSQVPRGLHNDHRILAAWARALQKAGDSDRAEAAIRKALKHGWSSELALEYSRIDTRDSEKQLARAEAWLEQHGDDPVLLMAVGRLCMRNELWGKARSYLETSLAIRPTAEAYQLYGRLLEKLGESVNASEAFRTGLSLATPANSDLPALTSRKTRR